MRVRDEHSKWHLQLPPIFTPHGTPMGWSTLGEETKWRQVLLTNASLSLRSAYEYNNLKNSVPARNPERTYCARLRTHSGFVSGVEI